MKRVLFLCTHNSARSQMAEALLRHLSAGRFGVYSAGTRPTAVHPMAVTVMQEIGIDISGQRSKDVGVYVQDSFNYLITVCDQAREECPIFPAARRQLHWSLPDPSAADGDDLARLAAFRRLRDDLATRIGEFIAGAEP
jgi:arsenate reductase